MITKNQIKFVRSLQQKKNRDANNNFIVEGEKMVEEMLKSNFDVVDIFATKNWDCPEKVAAKLHNISEKELERISSLKTPNKVVAIVEIPERELNLSEICKGLTLVLDEVKNPGNLGTIIRVCDWFGVENIICSKHSVQVYNPKVVQATMGSIARVKVHYIDIEKMIKKLPKNFPVYGACLQGENVAEMKLEENALLIMGNESLGISDKILDLVTQKVNVKASKKGAESLNVSIATSILLHEFRR